MKTDVSDKELLVRMKKLVAEIKEETVNIATEERSLDCDYRAKKENLSKRLAEVRKRCPHPTTTYHPDPSGNSDSYYECTLCGGEI